MTKKLLLHHWCGFVLCFLTNKLQQGGLQALTVTCLDSHLRVLRFSDDLAVTFDVRTAPKFANVKARLGRINLLYIHSFVQNSLAYSTEISLLAALLQSTTKKAVKEVSAPSVLQLDIEAANPLLEIPHPSLPHKCIIADLGRLSIVDVDGRAICIKLAGVSITSLFGHEPARHGILDNIDFVVNIVRQPTISATCKLKSLILSLTQEEYLLVAELGYKASLIASTSMPAEEQAMIPKKLVSPSTVRIPSFSAQFDMEEFIIQLPKLAKFSMQRFCAKCSGFEGGAVVMEFTIPEINIRDIRPNCSPHFNQLLAANSSKDKPVILVHYEIQPSSCASIDITLDRPAAYVIPHAVKELMDFFTVSFATPSTALRTSLALSLPQLPAIKLAVVVTNPEMILLEDVSRPDTHAIGLHFDAKTSLNGLEQAIILSIDNLEIFSCRFDQRSTTQVSILHPWNLFAEIRMSEDIRLALHTGACDINIAYNDVKLLIMAALTLAPRRRDVHSSESVSNAIYTPRPLSEPLDNALSASLMGIPQNLHKCLGGRKLIAQATLPSLYMKIVNDFNGESTPFLDLSLTEFSVATNDLVDTSLHCILNSNYFNDYVSSWEPLIEAWEFKAKLHWDSFPEFEFSSGERLELTVTPSFTASLVSIFKTWMHDYNSYSTSPDGTIKRSTFYPYRVRNYTGDAVVCHLLFSENVASQQKDKGGKIFRIENQGVIPVETPRAGLTLTGKVRDTTGRKLTSWMPLNRVGSAMFARLTDSGLESTSGPMAVEVSLERGCKVITLRSHVSVKNDTSLTIDLKISARGATHIIPKVVPGAVAYIPVKYANECALSLRPDQQLGQYEWSEPVKHSDLKDPVNRNCLAVVLDAMDEFEGTVLPTMHYFIFGENVRITGQTNMFLQFVIRAPLEIHNSLLCKTHYQIRDLVNDDLTKSEISSSSIDRIHHLDPAHALTIRLKPELPGFEWSPPETIWDPKSGTLGSRYKHKLEAVFMKQKALLSLVLQLTGRMGRNIRVSITSPYWIINRAKHAVQFDMPLLTVAGASNVPVFFSPGKDFRTRMRIENLTQWSPFFPMNTAGTNVLVMQGSVPQTEVELLLTTQILRAPFEGVRLLTVTPHYILHNESPIDLFFFLPSMSKPRVLLPGKSSPLYCVPNKIIQVCYYCSTSKPSDPT